MDFAKSKSPEISQVAIPAATEIGNGVDQECQYDSNTDSDPRYCEWWNEECAGCDLHEEA